MPTSDESSRPDAGTSTRAVHAGEPRSQPLDALTTPIVATSTYSFRDTRELTEYMEGRHTREEYGRYGNPTVRVLERKIAALEGCEDGLAFGSGMAALTTAILAFLKSGSHVVLFRDCYRRTRQFVGPILERFGVTHTLVDPGDLDDLERALRPETRLIVSEMPTNPSLNLVDLERLATIARGRRVKTIIDSTFATPVNLTPAAFGIDLVVHSATKYLAGHNDVLAGLVAGPEGFVSLVRDMRDVLGGVCDPHAAYLVLRGMKTLELRVLRQNQTALALARVLEAHPKIARVFYPGLESHPHHALAKRYLPRGAGGVVTFELRSDLAGTGRFIDALQVPHIAPSLGGVESLVEQPALMSYFALSSEERSAVGIPDALVRYAVGIENELDIVDDARHALDMV